MSYQEKLKEYYEVTKNESPSDLLIEAVSYVKNKNEALDLGCGAGKDSRFLLENRFSVTAVDLETLAKEFLDKLPQDKLKIFISSIEDFEFENYDLINASRSLPYIEETKFKKVFEKIKHSLNKDGLLAFNLSGKSDARNTGETTGHNPRIYFDKSEVQNLISNMEIIKFEETQEESTSPLGEKRMIHLFSIIAKNN